MNSTVKTGMVKIAAALALAAVGGMAAMAAQDVPAADPNGKTFPV